MGFNFADMTTFEFTVFVCLVFVLLLIWGFTNLIDDLCNFTSTTKQKIPAKPSKPQNMYVTMGYDLLPTTTDGTGVFFREVENILNAKYYPTGVKGEWPCDPDTGEKLDILPNHKR